ncbi:MAG TPA: penicillin-binding transpeptidase domain-containing protein [Solirubrobacteraceae bacterium]|nr:penicillin-binding transpeptidase domain-containing protein [Solirubrobacteraceae bacterium]
MSAPPEDRRPTMTPQLALRVAIVGSFALGLFAIVFFRLWFLQVLSGDQYVKAATVNRVRRVEVAAPRGEVLDASGTTLVDSVKTLAVQISPEDLPQPATLDKIERLEHPPKADAIVYNRLAHVLGLSTKRTVCHLHMPKPNAFRLSPVACAVAEQVTLQSYADVTVRSGPVVTRIMQYYLAENQRLFPGVQVQYVYVTHYPYKDLAAQVLGTVGPITATQFAAKSYSGAARTDIVGQSGLEAEYDSFLRGKDGYQQVQVNALNQPTGDLGTKPPVSGHNLKLSLNSQLQRVGEQALAQSMSLNASPGGSFVAMNPDTGAVYAMGSLPSFDPSIFTGNLSQTKYDQLTNPNSGDALLNRATQSAGPTGSTFKPITSVAALTSGEWTTDSMYDDTGQFCVGTGAAQQCRHNAGHAVDGSLNLVNALRVSSDDFFYNLGARLNVDPSKAPQGGPLDVTASKFGIGKSTDVDLPGEAIGTLPTPAWRQSRNDLEAECDSATGQFKWTDGHVTSSHHHKGWYRTKKHAPGGCGIADGTNRPWSIGDNESLAVGQGDVQVTPLQLAVAYSALANGHSVVRPHFGVDVQDQDGTVLQAINPPNARSISINPLYRSTILQGLNDAAQSSGGTSDDVMGNFPMKVYGKTGTAQYINQPDYGWYACFVIDNTNKPIVVVVHVEKGGFGDVAAAPVARQILSQWFYGKPGKYVAGTNSSL